jgi:hypothetical protein
MTSTNRTRSALLWTLVTAVATTVIAYLAVEGVSAEVKRGSQPASVDTLGPAWSAAYLLAVPVYLAARRSALLALPVVAIAMVPQFLVASVGLDRLRKDDGLEALMYVVPILMTALCLVAAAVGVGLRLYELHRQRLAASGPPPGPARPAQAS